LRNAGTKQVVFYEPCKSPPGGGSIAKVGQFIKFLQGQQTQFHV